MKGIMTSALLLLVLCVSAFSQNASDFTVDANSVITKYIGFDTDVVIPSVIGGKKITAIGNEAFRKAEITSVTIPGSVKSIGHTAFDGCTSLTSVRFEGMITSGNLDGNAFGFHYENDNYIGNLRIKYLIGGIGTYTREKGGYIWEKQ
jgi:hypothetical protein